MQIQAARLAASLAIPVMLFVGAPRLVAAQPAGGQPAQTAAAAVNPMTTAIDVNRRRSALYLKGDTAGIASLYTEDAVYTALMPVLQTFTGAGQIKGHFDDLINANAVNIVPTIIKADPGADGTIVVSGDYVVLSSGNTDVSGHFMQILRQRGGTWQIAVHVFARPDPITPWEVSASGRD